MQRSGVPVAGSVVEERRTSSTPQSRVVLFIRELSRDIYIYTVERESTCSFFFARELVMISHTVEKARLSAFTVKQLAANGVWRSENRKANQGARPRVHSSS